MDEAVPIVKYTNRTILNGVYSIKVDGFNKINQVLSKQYCIFRFIENDLAKKSTKCIWIESRRSFQKAF